MLQVLEGLEVPDNPTEFCGGGGLAGMLSLPKGSPCDIELDSAIVYPVSQSGLTCNCIRP